MHMGARSTETAISRWKGVEKWPPIDGTSSHVRVFPGAPDPLADFSLGTAILRRSLLSETLWRSLIVSTTRASRPV